jgi:hypothetical protein
MKKVMLLTLALCVAFSFSAFASNSTTVTGWVTDPMCGAKHAKEGSEACVKGCSEKNGGKLAIVTDGDSKVWAVENSEALKGHEGHHVKITGAPNADKGTFKVETVAMAAGDKKEMKKEEKKEKKDMKEAKKDEKKG